MYRNLQVLNHGVPEQVIANIKRDIHEFFMLPLEVKSAYAQRPGDLQGYGQAYVFFLKIKSLTGQTCLPLLHSLLRLGI
jgi:isopenicillin N synthase-like dioxygenase